MRMPLLLVTLAVCPAGAQEETLLTNGGFEEVRAVEGPASPDQGFGVWALGDNRLVPVGWSLNPAYPGSLEVRSNGAAEGERFLGLRADGARGVAHVHQPCPAVRTGGAYHVSARARGGPVNLAFYEYYTDGTIRVNEFLKSDVESEGWREVAGHYFPTGENLRSVSFAIIVPEGAQVDMDDVRIEQAPELAVPDDLEPVVLESDLVRVTLSPTGLLEEFTCKATGVNYAAQEARMPVFAMRSAAGEAPVRFIRRQGSVIDIQFARPDMRASLRYENRGPYFTLTVRSVSPDDVEWVQLFRLRLDITHSVGTLLNAAWDEDFAACVLACNEITHSFGASEARADLMARSYRQYGMPGGRVAVIGTPLDAAGPTGRLLDVIERVQLDQGLPHPTIKGVWIKRAPERFASYLMAAGASEANIDEVIEFARGAFGCIELLNWWHSTPTYEPHPNLFPNGLDGMRAVADKIRAAGMEVGLHTMQAMVGWGGVGMRDPYVSPRADPRLLRSRHATLVADLAEGDDEIAVAEDLADWPDSGDLFLDGELVRYARKTDTGFADCTRGLHGTDVRPHRAGTPVGLMVNCFPIWGHVIYAPDVNSTMVDEVCANIARVFNATRAGMSYFDGGEEIHVQPPRWRNQGRVALGVTDRLDEGIILSGNALYTNLSWHVITRGSPNFDPITYGRRYYTLRWKGTNPARWARNLLTGDVGWFQAHVHCPAKHAVTPDEVMLLVLKAVGGKAPISFLVHSSNLYANKRMPEMLEIIRAGDQIKREGLFSDAVCAQLSEPWAEHTLERGPDGRWRVRPMEFRELELVSAGEEAPDDFAFANPHAPQRPWLRVRARTRLAPFGAEGNVVLADCADEVPFTPDGAATPGLAPRAEPSAQTAPDGSATFAFSAHNAATSPSGWARVSRPFETPLDLSRHRPLGLWVHSEGKGGILNVQLTHSHSLRDHYINLDYTGWRYHVLQIAEAARHYDYSWPYSWTSLLYRRFLYQSVEAINLYYNALPAESEVTCLISRIEALREHNLPLENPSLRAGETQVTLPVSLRPDEYAELDWDGTGRHFEPNGGLLGEFAPQGELRLETGENAVVFSCAEGDERSLRAEVSVATRGEPLDNTGAPGVAQAPELPGDELHAAFSTGRGLRLVRGLHERVGREPARAVAAFDGAANAWTVTHDGLEPRGAALLVDYTAADDAAAPDEAEATIIEDFSDLAAYDMSDENRYAQYVVGGGRVLSAQGPVREGVSQRLAPCEGPPGRGEAGARYTAVNEGGPGGWSGIGRRFSPPLDLSDQRVLALWVHGDAGGQLLKLQFRDTAGAWRDWNMPIEHTGWQRRTYRPDRAPGFDWSQVEYIIFYYNGIPARRSVEVRLSGLVAAPRAVQPATLNAPRLVLNDREIPLGEALAPGEALTLDDRGRVTRWAPGMWRSRETASDLPPLVLQPGANRLELRCDDPPAAPSGLTVRVVPL